MGVPGTLADNRLVQDWPSLDEPTPPADPDIVQRRPDVTAAEARLAAAASVRDLARAGRVPDVTVGAQYEHYPISETNTNGSGNSYGVFVSIPLFVRHSNGGEARRAEVDYYAALADSSGSLKAEDSDDGLHPNSAGYRIMAPLALAAIDRKNEPDMQQKHRRPRLRF